VTSSETLDAGTSGVMVAGAAGTIINNGQIAATHTSTDSVVAFVAGCLHVDHNRHDH
jgi:hypothetical protein